MSVFNVLGQINKKKKDDLRPLNILNRVENRSVMNGDWTLSSRAQSPRIEVIMAMQQKNTSGNNGNERRGSLVEETH